MRLLAALAGDASEARVTFRRPVIGAPLLASFFCFLYL